MFCDRTEVHVPTHAYLPRHDKQRRKMYSWYIWQYMAFLMKTVKIKKEIKGMITNKIVKNEEAKLPFWHSVTNYYHTPPLCNVSCDYYLTPPLWNKVCCNVSSWNNVKCCTGQMRHNWIVSTNSQRTSQAGLGSCCVVASLVESRWGTHVNCSPTTMTKSLTSTTGKKGCTENPGSYS